MDIVKASSIQEIQAYFDHLYGDINKNRDWQEIYGYLARTTGYLTRNVLKQKHEIRDFMRSFSWLFALANKMDIDVYDSFYKKFPNICPYCLDKGCCCVRTNKKPKEDKPAYKIKGELESKFDAHNRFNNKMLAGAVKNINDIYPANDSIWHFAGPWVNCSKLFEEVAEIHEAISKFKVNKKSKENVEEEFADVFAWLLSAWSSCYREKNLDEEMINYFFNGCPVCSKNPCSCDTNASRIQGIVDAEKFAELRGLFEELENLSPNAKEDIKELIQSLKSVEDSQSETVANAAVSEAKVKYEKLKGTLEKTDAVTSKLASIGKAINYLASLL